MEAGVWWERRERDMVDVVGRTIGGGQSTRLDGSAVDSGRCFRVFQSVSSVTDV